MKTNFIHTWYDNLLTETSGLWRQTVKTNGAYRKYAGPRILSAAVGIEFSPKEHFEVDDVLASDIAEIIQEREWYEYIVFGVLDIMLTSSPLPIKNFKLTIFEVEFNEIESTKTAFRLAARDAARKAYKIQENIPY